MIVMAPFLMPKKHNHNFPFPLRILLADDDSLIRWSLHQSLAARGHEVIQAQCGNAALSLLQTQSFDVILTDLRLPEADGFKIVEAARSSSPDIPVIMMSAYGNRDIQEEVVAHKINYFLNKPLSVEHVASLVESFSVSGKA